MKYGPLLAYLATLPPEQTAVTLTFTELEALAGPLSVTARTAQGYWVNVIQRLYWRPSGWTARLHYVAGSVTFTRT